MLPSVQQELESLCSGPLPQRWLQLISQYPEDLRSALRSDDGSEEEGAVGDAELLADPADILAINREVRASSIPDPANKEFHWPARCLVIGESGDGDYYCLNADDPHCGVLQFLHLTVRFKKLTASLDEFLQMLSAAYLEADDADEWDDSEESDDEADDDTDQ